VQEGSADLDEAKASRHRLTLKQQSEAVGSPRLVETQEPIAA
jgi:hypothetical protein